MMMPTLVLSERKRYAPINHASSALPAGMWHVTGRKQNTVLLSSAQLGEEGRITDFLCIGPPSQFHQPTSQVNCLHWVHCGLSQGRIFSALDKDYAVCLFGHHHNCFVGWELLRTKDIVTLRYFLWIISQFSLNLEALFTPASPIWKHIAPMHCDVSNDPFIQSDSLYQPSLKS